MTNAINTVNSLLNVAAKASGASPEEQHTAALHAARLARKHNLGGFTIAKARRVLYQAERRLAGVA
jgi:hypothetical protein